MPGATTTVVDSGRWGSANRRTLVDRLVERAADARLEPIARRAQLGRLEDEPAVGSAAADGRVGGANGGVAARADRGERGPGVPRERQRRARRRDG